MAVATAITRVQDLLDDLGGISPWRVLLRPAPGTATEADLIAVNASGKILCELVDGVLVEKGMGFAESILAGAIIALLREFVIPRNLGVVASPDGMIRLFPGLIRAPDVAFVSWDRLPGGSVPRDPVPTLAPELVVEVLSRSNTGREMGRRRREYFSVGVDVVWEIDPESRTAVVYRRGDERPAEYDQSAVLEEPGLLPGFRLPLARLFGELDRKRDSR